MKYYRALFVMAALMVVMPAFSQVNVKEKIKEKTSTRVENKVDEGIDKGLDKIEQGISGLFKKKKKDAAKENENQISQSKDTSVVLKGVTKYDFVPGDKILFYEDFSQDAIGDFPALWTTNGGGEVKTINIATGNWLHMNKEGSYYCFSKSVDIPSNFIMEFDIVPDDNFQSAFEIGFYQSTDNEEFTDDLYPGKGGLQIFMDEEGWGTKGYINEDGKGWLEGHSATNPCAVNSVNHVIIWVQNRRLRIYHKGAKVLDSPTNIYDGIKFNRFRFSGWNTECKPYVSNLKITTASPDVRSKLLTEGKLVSYGIFFDVNKATVKPESHGALNDIAKTLSENPTVKVMIVGHTDSDGDAANNLDLSKRRADAVKRALVDNYGVSREQLTTDGKGETVPVAPNSSAEGKAKNRRVEFVKI